MLSSGAVSYSCNAMTTYISKLHANAGIEGGSAQSARRTFVTKLHRKGYDYRHEAILKAVKEAEKKVVESS